MFFGCRKEEITAEAQRRRGKRRELSAVSCLLSSKAECLCVGGRVLLAPRASVADRMRNTASYHGRLARADGAKVEGLDLSPIQYLSLIHISEPTRQAEISYAVFCLKKKKT